MIKVGDTITVDVAPLRDGREGGYMIAALTASGTSSGCSPPRNARASAKGRRQVGARNLQRRSVLC
jgi:hypothetical protein